MNSHQNNSSQLIHSIPFHPVHDYPVSSSLDKNSGRWMNRQLSNQNYSKIQSNQKPISKSFHSLKSSISSDGMYDPKLFQHSESESLINLGISLNCSDFNKMEESISIMEWVEGKRAWEDQFSVIMSLKKQHQEALKDLFGITQEIKQSNQIESTPEKRGVSAAVASPHMADHLGMIKSNNFLISKDQVDRLLQMEGKVQNIGAQIQIQTQQIKDSTMKLLVDTQRVSNQKIQNYLTKSREHKMMCQKQYLRADRYKTQQLKQEFEMKENNSKYQALLDKVTELANQNEELRNKRIHDFHRYEDRIVQIEQSLSNLLRTVQVVSQIQQQNSSNIGPNLPKTLNNSEFVKKQHIQIETNQAKKGAGRQRSKGPKQNGKNVRSPKNSQSQERNTKSMMNQRNEILESGGGKGLYQSSKQGQNKSWAEGKDQTLDTMFNTKVTMEIFKIYSLIKQFREQDQSKIIKGSSKDLITNFSRQPKNNTITSEKSVDKAFVMYQEEESNKKVIGKKSPNFENQILGGTGSFKEFNLSSMPQPVHADQNLTIEFDVSFSKELGLPQDSNTDKLVDGFILEDDIEQDGQNKDRFGGVGQRQSHNDNRITITNVQKAAVENSMNFSNIISQINSQSDVRNDNDVSSGLNHKSEMGDKVDCGSGPMIFKFKVENYKQTEEGNQNNSINLSSIILAVSDDQHPYPEKEGKLKKKGGLRQKLFNTTMKISEILKMTQLNNIIPQINSKTPKNLPLKSPLLNQNQELDDNKHSDDRDKKNNKKGIQSETDIRAKLVPTDPNQLFSTVNISKDDAESLINLLKDFVKIKIGRGQYIKIPKLNLASLPQNFPQKVQTQIKEQMSQSKKQEKGGMSIKNEPNLSEISDSSPDSSSSENDSSSYTSDSGSEHLDSHEKPNQSSFLNFSCSYHQQNLSQLQQQIPTNISPLNKNFQSQIPTKQPSISKQVPQIMDIMQFQEQLDKSLNMAINETNNSVTQNYGKMKSFKKEIENQAHLNRLQNNVMQLDMSGGIVDRSHSLIGLDGLINLSNILPDQSQIANQMLQNNIHHDDIHINGEFERFVDSNIVESHLIRDSKMEEGKGYDHNQYSNQAEFLNIKEDQGFNFLKDGYSLAGSAIQSLGNSVGMSGFLDITSQGLGFPFEADNEAAANDSIQQQKPLERSKRRKQLSKGTLGFLNLKPIATHQGAVTSKANAKKNFLLSQKWEGPGLSENKDKEVKWMNGKFPQSTKCSQQIGAFGIVGGGKNQRRQDLCNLSNFQSSNRSITRSAANKSKPRCQKVTAVNKSLRIGDNGFGVNMNKIPQTTKNQKSQKNCRNQELQGSKTLNSRQGGNQVNGINPLKIQASLDMSCQNVLIKSSKNQIQTGQTREGVNKQKKLEINTMQNSHIENMSIRSPVKSVDQTTQKLFLPIGPSPLNQSLIRYKEDIHREKALTGYNSLLSAELRSNKSTKIDEILKGFRDQRDNETDPNLQFEQNNNVIHSNKVPKIKKQDEKLKNLKGGVQKLKTAKTKKSVPISNQIQNIKEESHQAELIKQKNLLDQLMLNQKKIQQIQSKVKEQQELKLNEQIQSDQIAKQKNSKERSDDKSKRKLINFKPVEPQHSKQAQEQDPQHQQDPKDGPKRKIPIRLKIIPSQRGDSKKSQQDKTLSPGGGQLGLVDFSQETSEKKKKVEMIGKILLQQRIELSKSHMKQEQIVQPAGGQAWNGGKVIVLKKGGKTQGTVSKKRMNQSSQEDSKEKRVFQNILQTNQLSRNSSQSVCAIVTEKSLQKPIKPQGYKSGQIEMRYQGPIAQDVQQNQSVQMLGGSGQNGMDNDLARIIKNLQQTQGHQPNSNSVQKRSLSLRGGNQPLKIQVKKSSPSALKAKISKRQ